MESSHLAEEEKETVDILQQQFMDLQKEWDSIKQSNPKPTKPASNPSSYSSPNHSISSSALQLLDTSPRDLMSSLQSPLQGAWRVRTNDLAVQEIIRDRRQAIETGKLRGRRLFDNQNHHLASQPQQDCEVRSISFNGSDGDEIENCDENPFQLQGCCCCCCTSSRSSNSSSLSLTGVNCETKKDDEQDLEAGGVKEEKGCNYIGGRATFLTSSWVAIVFLVFAICIIRIFGGQFGYGYGDESQNKVILVPT